LSPTQRQNQSATCALGSVHPKAGAQAPRVRWGVSTQKQSPSATCALGVSNPNAGAPAPHGRRGCTQPPGRSQAPRVPTWFFFDNNNNLLKFINDDNNNTNCNF